MELAYSTYSALANSHRLVRIEHVLDELLIGAFLSNDAAHWDAAVFKVIKESSDLPPGTRRLSGTEAADLRDALSKLRIVVVGLDSSANYTDGGTTTLSFRGGDNHWQVSWPLNPPKDWQGIEELLDLLHLWAAPLWREGAPEDPGSNM